MGKRLTAPPGWWSQKESANFLNVSEPTVKSWAKKKILKSSIKGNYLVFAPKDVRDLKKDLVSRGYYKTDRKVQNGNIN